MAIDLPSGAPTLGVLMKPGILIAAFAVLSCTVSVAEDKEAPRVLIETRIATANSVKSQKVYLRLEPGLDKNMGTRYPMLRVLVLPFETKRVPLQISLIAESGATLSSTTAYYTPENGLEFSLDTEGMEAEGKISRWP